MSATIPMTVEITEGCIPPNAKVGDQFKSLQFGYTITWEITAVRASLDYDVKVVDMKPVLR